MGYENEKKDTPPPYDPNGKGVVCEGRGAPEAPLNDADEKSAKEEGGD